LQAVLAALKDPAFDRMVWRNAPPITQEALRLVHTQAYIDTVLAPVHEGEERIFDFETFAVSGTAEAALYSAGLVVRATEAVASGEARRAFCVVSPSGHHAEADSAHGYCFFNHIAVAAVAAQRNLGVSRIAVLDFDAHHGNGTQNLFWNYENRLFISLHEETGLSGFAHETGVSGNILNIPLATGSAGAVFRQAIETQALPKVKTFRPDILFVSAGFDMHTADPLSGLCLETEDYAWLGQQLGAFADSVCQGKLVAALEGGYNLDVLGPCVAAFVKSMMGEG
jgi:acetoin utilization deacetylase AcuC-like enzyme